MLEALPLIVVTLVLVSAFVSIVATTQLEDIRKNWEQRRCEPLVMIMAQMVPTDPNSNTSDFASENFQFCIGRIADGILGTLFSPILKIFNKQIDVTNNLKGATNTLNSAAGSLMSPISNIFTSVNKKFTAVLYQIIRVFYKIQTAIDRIFGIATASVFAGISMYKGIQNTMNFIIKIIIIILSILVVLVIFLWFIMFPFIPIILTTIGILSATVAGASAAGMAGSFCVAPGTKINMEDGSKLEVEKLNPGDKIEGSVIEGILKTSGRGAICVSLKGITLSACHLVFYEPRGWIPAGEHPEAIPFTNHVETLYCLNTSSRTWKAGELLLRDWEELPDSEDSDKLWEELVFELLNRQAIISSDAWTNTGRGLLGPNTLLYVRDKGILPVHEVKIGDFVKDCYKGEEKFTEVLGVYRDTSKLPQVPSSGPNASSWVWLEGKCVWRHPLTPSANSEKTGYHLITESGTFLVGSTIVRDFTEVGSSRIEKTYDFTSSLLNSPEEGRNV